MQVGVSTASLFVRKYNEDALPLFDELGIPVAEVFLATFSEYGKEYASLLSQRKGGVKINSVHILNTQFEPQLFNPHPRARADAFAWLDKVLESANALSAPYYTFHGIARVKSASRSGIHDNFPAIARDFRAICEACEKRGVTLCLENVEWASYNRPGVFSRISSEAPMLLGVLDIKQARISGYGYEEYIADMGEKLAYAHLSDLDEMGRICLPGRGVFDFDTLIKRLKDVGFDGALLIEVYKDDYDDFAQLKTACDFLGEKLYKYR